MPGEDIKHLADWRGSAFRTADDEQILAACFEEGRTLVSYHQRTIPGLLRLWAADEREHVGVIFGDENSVPPDNAGAVARAIVRLLQENAGADITNAVLYLKAR